mgnify:CR=1 FL=1
MFCTTFEAAMMGIPLHNVSVIIYSNGLRSDTQSGDSIPQNLKIAIYVTGGIYTIAAVVGLLGFLGAICKKTGFVRTYFILLCTTFGFQIGSSIWYLVTFFRTRGLSEADCLKSFPKQVNGSAYCESVEQLKNVHPGWVVAGALIPVLVIGCE